MPNYAYERLTAEDASYLLFESPNAHMHLSWAWILDGGSLVGADGGVDVERVRRHVAARLFRFPRFRQRVRLTPLEGHPVWVDDERFKLHYHVRHTALPDPGDEARLKAIIAAIVSQPLDRSKPLWELWIIEGLQEGRLCIVSKTHHCMVDGVSTVDLMTGLLDPAPRPQPDEPGDWIPRPGPNDAVLLRDAVIDRVTLACGVGRDVAGTLGRAASPRGVARALRGIGRIVGSAVRQPPVTPINQPIGPHRLVNWLRWPLQDLRTIGRRLGGAPNHVALAAVADGLGRFLEHRGTSVRGVDLRVVVPVGARDGHEPGVLGNRTMARLVTLPLDEAISADRVRRLAEQMVSARDDAWLRDDLWLRASEVGGQTVLGWGVALRRRMYGCNLVVTTIPGPAEPRYFLDARLLSAYPFVPLLEDQGLGFGLSTYCDTLHLGVVSDWEIVPDLGALVAHLEAALQRLRDAAAVR